MFYVGCCMVCGLFQVKWALVWYLGYFRYEGYCIVLGLLYCMCAVLCYVGSCMVCGLLYSMWDVV